MNQADKQYLDIVQKILDEGTWTNNRTGMPAIFLPHQIMKFDLQKEFPDMKGFSVQNLKNISEKYNRNYLFHMSF